MSALEEASRAIVEFLKSRGGSADAKTIVEGLREKGVAKATVYRALNVLLSIGTVKRVERGTYALAERVHTLLAMELGRGLGHLFKCENPEKLGEDIARELGSDIEKIVRVHEVFISEVLPSLETSGAGDRVFLSLVESFLRSREVFVLLMIEAFKPLMLKRMLDEGCEDILVGLTKDQASNLERAFEVAAENFSRYFRVNANEVSSSLMKLRNVLVRHGYKGVIWMRAFNTDVSMDLKDLTEAAFATICAQAKGVTAVAIARCLRVLFTIADSLMGTGCRPLGTIEKELLSRNCEFLRGSSHHEGQGGQSSATTIA